MLLRTPEDFRAYENSNGFLSHNHLHICSVSPEQAIVNVELTPESCNASGFVHGGLLMSLVDVAASQAAMGNGSHYVTQNTFVNFISNVKGGTITATASIIKRGRKTAVVHVDVRGSEEKLLADASVTMMCVE